MSINLQIKEIAFKIRKYRELNNITREKFCEMTGQNVEYWGSIERGERGISLQKLLEICKTFNIKIDELVQVSQLEENNVDKVREITEKLKKCSHKKLALIEKFIDEIIINI